MRAHNHSPLKYYQIEAIDLSASGQAKKLGKQEGKEREAEEGGRRGRRLGKTRIVWQLIKNWQAVLYILYIMGYI